MIRGGSWLVTIMGDIMIMWIFGHVAMIAEAILFHSRDIQTNIGGI